jgi:hypothetical protein
MTERVHHPYSPSTLQSREACPKYIPSQNETEASIAGTMQHDAVEAGQDDHRLSDLQAVAVAECLKYAEERLRAFPGGSHCREIYLPMDDEKIVSPDGKVFEGTTAGYVDFAIVSKDETDAELLDWKFGKWAVTEAENNLQGIAYMLGLKKMFPKLEHCTVRFIQPHIDFSSSHTFDISNPDPYILRVRTVVHRAVAAARNPADYSSARPNVGSCLFCSLVGQCPKVADYALQIGKKFMPLALPKDLSTLALSDPAQVAVGLKLAQVVNAWAESYRKQATMKAIEDDFVPDGYSLVPSQKTVIKNAKQVGDAAKKFLPAEDAEKVEALYEISLTPLDKLISLRAPRGVKEATVKEFREQLLANGATEMGVPYAFLRQITVKDVEKTSTQ